jgi:hypothetical protein
MEVHRMAIKKSENTEIKEIMYFETPRRSNTDRLLEFVMGKIETLGITHVMIAWSSGYTLFKFLKATKDLKLKLDVTTVSNPKGGTIGGRKVHVDDKTRAELEKQGVKVCYLNDDLKLGEPWSPSPWQKEMRKMLVPWIPAHIDPLSMDVGVDLSMLLMFSQGFRVCAGCLALAVKRRFIPQGARTLCFAGQATAAVFEASAKPRTCYVREILGFERNSDWLLLPKKNLKKMYAITKDT